MKKVTLILCVKLMAAMMLASCTGGGNESLSSTEVTIGKQVWMTQNLNVDKFRNGEVIPEAKTKGEWEAYSDAGEAAWCYYENDTANGAKYGKLYNGYAISDSRGLAPVGYHIPSDAEWEKLSDYLGESAGAKMKSKQGWAEDNSFFRREYITAMKKLANSSGFSGLPGGYRFIGGKFSGIGKVGYWWSSTESGTDALWSRHLSYDSGGESGGGQREKGFGYSVRCLRD